MQRFYRVAIYSFGVLLQSVGVALHTKTGLGVPPVASVAYGISEIWVLNFAMVNFVLYLVFIAAEILLQKKAYLTNLFQLPFSFAFNFLLNVFGGVIQYDKSAHGLFANLVVLVLAIGLSGAGASLTVGMRLVTNPGDGITFALSQRLKWDQGFTKNIVDITAVSLVLAMGLFFKGTVVGVGLGTLVAMFGTGRVMSLVDRLLERKVYRLAGLTQCETAA